MYPYVVCLCGRPLGHLYNAFLAMVIAQKRAGQTDEPVGAILDQLMITKTCCRARLISGREFKEYYNVPGGANIAPTVSMPKHGDKTRASATPN